MQRPLTARCVRPVCAGVKVYLFYQSLWGEYIDKSQNLRQVREKPTAAEQLKLPIKLLKSASILAIISVLHRFFFQGKEPDLRRLSTSALECRSKTDASMSNAVSIFEPGCEKKGVKSAKMA